MSNSSMCPSSASNEQIAGCLRLQTGTAKRHVQGLMDKLGLHDRHAIADFFNQPIVYSPAPLWGGETQPTRIMATAAGHGKKG